MSARRALRFSLALGHRARFALLAVARMCPPLDERGDERPRIAFSEEMRSAADARRVLVAMVKVARSGE